MSNTEKCPTCGQSCTISWAGLVSNSGDERDATKLYQPIIRSEFLDKHITHYCKMLIKVRYKKQDKVIEALKVYCTYFQCDIAQAVAQLNITLQVIDTQEKNILQT
jgi:hypothetical protein